jgi:hypothetical protein
MKCAIFLGPTFHGLDPGLLNDVDVLPPAACGDILRQVQGGRKVIALVDGVFEAQAAVWHKEILYAISRGCHVLGAASMGALRAAECCGHGMEGVGRVFESYRSGARLSDADVAIVHGPEELGYVPLSVSLVDVEYATNRLARTRTISPATATRLLRVACKTNYKQRSWTELFSAAIPASQHRSLEQRIAAMGPLQKARDALSLLARLKTLEPNPPAASNDFINTIFFQKLMETIHENNNA